MKGIGKPCTGKLYARFDEGGLALPALYSTLNLLLNLLLDLLNLLRCIDRTSSLRNY